MSIYIYKKKYPIGNKNMYQRLDWHMVLYIRPVHMKCGQCFATTHLLSAAFQSNIGVFIPPQPLTKPWTIFRCCSYSPIPAYRVCVSCSAVIDSAIPWTVAHQAPLSMDFPDKTTGVGSHFLLQGIFPTQGSNWHLLHSRQILYHLSHQLEYQFNNHQKESEIIQVEAGDVLIYLLIRRQ